MSTTQKKEQSDKIDQVLDGDGDIPPWEKKAAGVEVEETVGIDFSKIPQIGEVNDPELLSNAETALVATEEAGGSSGRVYSEFLDFDLEDMSIPRLRLASGQSQEVTDRKALPGQFLMPDHAAVDELELVIIATTPFRRYQIEAPGGSRVQLCKSDDGIHGVGNPGGICARCPLSQWGERNPVTGRGEPPACADGWSYQIFSLTHGSMAVWDLSKTGMQAARKINTSLKMRKYRNFVVQVKSLQQKGPSGVYYTPVIETRPITPEERAEVDQSVYV